MKRSRYNRIRMVAYPFFVVVVYLLFILINPLENMDNDYKYYTAFNYVLDAVATLAFTVGTIESGIGITRLLNRYLPWEEIAWRRIAVQLLLQAVALALIFAMLIPIFSIITDENFYQQFQDLILRQAVVLGALISLLSTSIFTAEYFFRKWAATRLEAVQLQQNATQARLDALTTQIDPHFLFNNLSTLTSLIEEDPQQAVEFVMRFTTVYRYMLSKRQLNVIPLSEEITFVNAYVFLYIMRYGSAFQLDVCIDGALHQKGIAPMTLQLLVENAVKHNLLTQDQPLRIQIAHEGEWLLIRNNLQRKRMPQEGVRLGLANIRERYRLLGQQEPQVQEDAHLFTVKIPLIQL